MRAQVPKNFWFPEIILSLKPGALNAVTRRLANLGKSPPATSLRYALCLFAVLASRLAMLGLIGEKRLREPLW